MRQLFDLLAAALRARDQFFFRLLLKVFETGEPTFKAVLFLTDEIVDDHACPG
jgi:hypothetical protein